VSPVKVVPLEEPHLDAAADLLARTHQVAVADCRSNATEPAVAREMIAGSLRAGPAVAALDGRSLAGYMIVPLPATPGPDTARWNECHHAAEPATARNAYRQMYAAVAPTLTSAGCFNHSVAVLPAEATVNAFFELGFGVDQIKGARRLLAETAPAEVASVRPAEVDDLDELVALSIELFMFHSRPPILRPALLGGFEPRADLQRNIESDASAVLVAHDDERLVGMMQAEADARYARAVTIGMNIVAEHARSGGIGSAMLRALTVWALEREFEHCTVGWSSANLVSDAFYRSRGFKPIRYRLARRVDPRIAWANERLDYRELHVE